jgi:hypothetical protein
MLHCSLPIVSALLLVLSTGLRTHAVGPRFAGDRDRWVGAEILLRDANVLKDLGLNDNQTFRASQALTVVAAKLNDDLQRIQNLKGDAWKARNREIIAKVPDRELEALAKHLTAAQVKRLREITYQVAGIDAFAHPDVVKQIAPTTEQKDKLKVIAAELETSMKDVQNMFAAGKVDAALKKEEELRAGAFKKVQELLTEKQKKTWQDLTGKAIQLEGAKKR